MYSTEKRFFEFSDSYNSMRHPIQLPNWQVYGLPHEILRVFNTILYENEFQKPQIFQQTISLFPEQSTLV
jgi:hypothetical protein